MAHPHRRALLDALRERGRTTDVEEAVAAVTTRGGDGGDADGRPATVRSVEVGLVHVHRPKLADAGVVEYDADAGTVRLGERAAEAERYLPG